MPNATLRSARGRIILSGGKGKRERPLDFDEKETMYKVIFVDDEAYVSRGLNIMLDWESRGIEVAGAAEDGAEALALIMRTRPDIVITDICMPRLSGLELMERCAAKLQKPPKFLMLTGYGELEYIKRAMRLGARGYLLKPIDRAELKEYIERIIDELEEEARREPRPQQSISAESFDNFRHTARTLENDKRISVDISAANDCIRHGRLDDAIREIGLMLDAMKDSGASPRRVCGAASVLLVSLYRYAQRAGAASEREFDRYAVKLSQTREIDEARGILTAAAECVKRGLAGRIEAGDIANIMDYIEENYKRDVSMVEIADEFDMKPARVSALVKKAVGMKFSEYINKLRLDEACRLLAATNRGISDIVAELGYKDYFYFTKKFKKAVGCLPSDYRKRVRGE